MMFGSLETSLYEENKVVPTIEKLKRKRILLMNKMGLLWFKSTEFEMIKTVS